MFFKKRNQQEPAPAQETSAPPVLSVIIPCCNVERYLQATLDSVCEQTLREIEVLCVDDGSEDGTSQVITDRTGKDSRVQMIRLPQNKGVSAARNEGLRRAKGEFVYFLDADDLTADPDVFAKFCGRMQEHGLDLLIGAGETVYDSETLKKTYPQFEGRYAIRGSYPDVMNGPASIKALRKNKDWFVTPGTRILRRSFLLQNELEFLEGYQQEDGLFTLETLFLAGRVGVLGETLYRRRIREDSIMTKPLTYKNTLGYIAILIEGLRFLEHHRDIHELDPVAGLSVAVSRRMAARTCSKLSPEEMKRLKSAMTPEQNFYFTTFIKEEADCLKKIAELERKSEAAKQKK